MNSCSFFKSSFLFSKASSITDAAWENSCDSYILWILFSRALLESFSHYDRSSSCGGFLCYFLTLVVKADYIASFIYSSLVVSLTFSIRCPVIYIMSSLVFKVSTKTRFCTWTLKLGESWSKNLSNSSCYSLVTSDFVKNSRISSCTESGRPILAIIVFAVSRRSCLSVLDLSSNSISMAISPNRFAFKMELATSYKATTSISPGLTGPSSLQPMFKMAM